MAGRPRRQLGGRRPRSGRKGGKQRVSGGPEDIEAGRTSADAREQRAQQTPSRDRRPEARRRQCGAFGRGVPAARELSAERGPGPPQTRKRETVAEVKSCGAAQEGPSVGGAVPASAPGRLGGRERCVCAAAGSEHPAPALCRSELKEGPVVRS